MAENEKIATIPKSRAKTAFALLSEVRTLILAEPLRYDQGSWLNRIEDTPEAYEQFPACGTVGCVAGWVATLKAKHKFDPEEAIQIAQDVLGLDDEQEYELFNEEAAGGKSQSLDHAREGARHIRRFQKKYCTQLLAKKV